MVVVFSLVGSHLSLTKACREAEAAFFDRSLLHADGYYTCPGDQLTARVDLTNRLLSVIGSDGQWAGTYETLRDARAALIQALDSRDIPAIAQANEQLETAVLEVRTMAEGGAPLDDSHDDWEAILSDLASAQALVDDPAYNEHILAFREEVLSPFPANILRHLTGVRAPETFP